MSIDKTTAAAERYSNLIPRTSVHSASCPIRRPLTGIAVSVAVGMLLSASAILHFPALFCCAILCVLVAWFRFRSSGAGSWVYLCIALTAACRFAVSPDFISPADISRLRPQMPLEQTQLVGRIDAPPYYQTFDAQRPGIWTVPFHCEGILSDGEWRRKRGTIRVRISGLPDDCVMRQGQRYRFNGTLQQRRMPGGEPFELRVDISSNSYSLLSDAPSFSPGSLGQQLRERASRRLEQGVFVKDARNGVYQALLLGYRKSIPPDIHEQFRRTGTLHIFAISGLHVGIIGMFLTVVLKTLGVPRTYWGIYLLPMLAAYVAVTGMKSSALRALTMAGVYFIAPLFCRKPDIPSSIAFAAILLLLLKPVEILSAGFIYSFTVVSFIVLFFARTPKERIYTGAGRWRTIRIYVVSLSITSVAAFIGSMPLTALFFGTFSPVSLIGNLFVVPLTFCIVLSGWLAILTPGMSSIFNSAAHLFIDLLLSTVGFLSSLPGGYMRVPPAPVTAVIFWYWGWIYLFVHSQTSRARRVHFAVIILSILLAVISGLMGYHGTGSKGLPPLTDHQDCTPSTSFSHGPSLMGAMLFADRRNDQTLAS